MTCLSIAISQWLACTWEPLLVRRVSSLFWTSWYRWVHRQAMVLQVRVFTKICIWPDTKYEDTLTCQSSFHLSTSTFSLGSASCLEEFPPLLPSLFAIFPATKAVPAAPLLHSPGQCLITSSLLVLCSLQSLKHVASGLTPRETVINQLDNTTHECPVNCYSKFRKLCITWPCSTNSKSISYPALVLTSLSPDPWLRKSQFLLNSSVEQSGASSSLLSLCMRFCGRINILCCHHLFYFI